MKKKFLITAGLLAMSAAFLAGCGNTASTEAATEAVTEATAEDASAEDASAEDASETVAIEDNGDYRTDVKTPDILGWNLLWADEFNGDTLDESIWNKELRDPGWTNNELQEYTDSDENIFVKDGHLTLKAIKTEKDGETYYTSGKVQTQNKKDFMYGKVCIRAKVPEGKGLWPAGWMMPTDESYYGQWPKCGEIDVMEVLGDDTSTAYGTIHYGEPHNQQQNTFKLTDGETFANTWHIFSVEWDPGEFRYYIDNQLYLTVNDWFTAVEGEEEKPFPAPFNQNFFVQLNLAVGGDWPGDPDDSTDFDNAEYMIDYVRVYQKDAYNTDVKKPELEYRDLTEDGNLIWNGDFSEAEALDDEDNWYFIQLNDGVGTAEIKDGELVVTTEKEGTKPHSIQIVQPSLPMKKGQKYKLTFDAYADEDRQMITCVDAPTAGWIRYLEDTTFDLTTEKQSFEFEFEMTEKNDNNGRLEFNMGNLGSTATVHISNVRLEIVE